MKSAWVRCALLVGALVASVLAILPQVAGADVVTLTLARTIQTNPFVGTTTRMKDGEGSAFVPSDDSLWLIEDVSGRAYEVNPTTGALKSVISNSDFQNAVQLGGTATAGENRAGDLEAMAYDPDTDTLYAFSGKCCTSAELPTAYRLRRGTNGKFAVESFQPLPDGSDFTGAAWAARDGKLYVGVNSDLRSYDYSTNSVGAVFHVRQLGGIYGMSFSADGSELFVVAKSARLYRVDWTTRSIEPTWSVDLKPFGIQDARGVEIIHDQLYVLDGYDSRDRNDPLKYAVYVFDMPGRAAPVASFTALPSSGVAPLQVAFTDTSSNGPTSWSWSFGDGGTSTDQNPVHTYVTAGTFSVTLTATNANGSGTVTQTELIAVSPGVPVASFTALPSSGVAPLQVAFTDTSTNGPTSWSWTFGDGGTSTDQNPVHTYVTAGTFSVTLTATNADGSGTVTQTDLITVSPTPAPETTITSGPASLSNITTAQFAFSSDVAGASFTCSLDGLPGQLCSSPFTASLLAEGVHTFSVAASTAGGGSDPTPAAASWTVDLTAPTATPVSPTDGATGVPLTGSAIVEFSESIDPSSLDGTTFLLQPAAGGPSVVANVSYDAPTKRGKLVPVGSLQAGTQYSVTVATGVRDLAGNSLAAPLSWSFTTTAGTGIRRESVSTVVNAVAASKITIPTPTGTQAGDVLVASLALNGSTVARTGVPTGWIPIAAVTGISNPRIYGYVHVAGSSEPASYEWKLNSAVAAGAGIARYSGVNPADPLDGPASVATGAASTTATIPGVTTTTANAVIVGGVAFNTSSTTIGITPTGGMATGWDIGGKRNVLADEFLPLAGPTGSRSWVLTASRAWAGWLVALRPV